MFDTRKRFHLPQNTYLESTAYPTTIMPLLLKVLSLPTPLVTLLLTSLLPTASAAGAAGTVHTSYFWLSFSLIVVISAVESAFSVIWTRIRITSDGIHPVERCCRVCGREITVSIIDPGKASEVTTRAGGCGYWRSRTVTQTYGLTKNVVIDQFGNLALVLSLLLRRFNPRTSMEAAARLVNTVKDLVTPSTKQTSVQELEQHAVGFGILCKERSRVRIFEQHAVEHVTPSTDKTVVRMLEHTVDLLFSLTDLSLGVAVLALNPGSPRELYNTLMDPKAPMTFQNYTTLFLLYWLLGAVLLLCILPQRSARASIRIFGWPEEIAFEVAGFASLVLFCLGCWKIDFARRHHTPWTPMLSYWISGASVVNSLEWRIDVLEVFGTVELVFMLIHTFN